jgi:hypothetical protein
MRVRGLALGMICGLALCASARPAGATPVTSSASAARTAAEDADALFRRAIPLMEQGLYAQAYPMLARSQELDSQLGTKLHLAYCLENLGRTATAWSLWLDAATEADAKHEPDRASYARQRATVLEPRLLHVTVAVSEQRDSDRIVVQLDGAVLPKDHWGISLPVDPGPHWVQASADGRRPWWAKIDVDNQHSPVVAIPVLKSDAVAKDATPPMHWSARRIAAVVMWGVGAAAVVGGVALVLSAKATYDAAGCQGQFCTSAGYDARSTAIKEANGATAVLVGGGAAFLGGTLLWLTARVRVDEVEFGPIAGRSALGLSLDGKW